MMKEKLFYLQNPSYPEAENNASVIQIVRLEKINANIVQVRLDFLEFMLDGGSQLTSPCDVEKCVIRGSRGNILNVGPLCGDNRGQHLYIPVDMVFDEVATISIETMVAPRGANVSAPLWNIMITQLDSTCAPDIPLIAPEGCDQYHKGRRRIF